MSTISQVFNWKQPVRGSFLVENGTSSNNIRACCLKKRTLLWALDLILERRGKLKFFKGFFKIPSVIVGSVKVQSGLDEVQEVLCFWRRVFKRCLAHP